MNTEMLFDALDQVPEKYKTEVLTKMERHYDPKHTKQRKTVKTILIAAAIACLMSLSAYAVGSAVNSPEAAEKTALQEIEKWKEMGLLSEDVSLEGKADAVYEIEERTGDEYWYGRIFRHRYDVRWYGSPYGEGGKYSGNFGVDTATGKLYAVAINANADEDDVPLRTVEVERETGDGKTETLALNVYDNFCDIFPEDMTVDRFCSGLAEYWGFGGYTLSDTHDEFYREDWSAVSGDSLLRDLPQDNYYLTIFFEGDQQGVPMYLQLAAFPGYVTLFLGTNHAVG